MPRLIPFRLVSTFALAFVLVLSTAAVAGAKGPFADLRVVGDDGKILAEKSFGAGTASVKASPRAGCFGAGKGGSGQTVTVKGPTALGMLIQASKFTAALRPLLITDAFDFGLGLCGVGGYEANKEVSWFLKVNHVNPELGGETVRVKAGDDVLWALAPYPYPDELWLQAPRNVQAGMQFGVRVSSYDEKGKRKPAAGVKVTGASAPTDKNGVATVVLQKPRRLIARGVEDIPSNREAVCVGGKCPQG